MLIDRNNGNLSLPNGCAITPELTQKLFRASSCGKKAKGFHYNTLPYMNFSLRAGLLGDYPLSVDLGFYAEMLVSVSLMVINTPDGATWDDYSEEKEREAKAIHDAALREELGEPHEVLRLSGYKGEDITDLSVSIRYRFSWGTVWSGHQERDGNTLIYLEYEGRRTEADALYRGAANRAV